MKLHMFLFNFAIDDVLQNVLSRMATLGLDLFREKSFWVRVARWCHLADRLSTWSSARVAPFNDLNTPCTFSLRSAGLAGARICNHILR